MKSMTGFGRSSNRALNRSDAPAKAAKTAKAVAKGGKKALAEIDISIKSVNGRYLDTRLHLPREYAALESEIKTMLGSIFSRGTIDVYLNRAHGTQVPDVEVNTELARKWLDGYRELGRALKIQSEPSLELLTRIPEVLRVEAHSELTDTEKKLALGLLREAAMACDSERAREGKSLKSELGKLCARLTTIAGQMESLKTDATSELERRYRDRLQKLGFEGKVDDQRLAQEIVMQLDRADISEELTRLREHLSAYNELLDVKEPQGKKLDFYAQELLREVNTIGSKSHIARLTALVVEAKTLVEKIRELVQNVE